MNVIGDVKIIPESLEYKFKIVNHTAKASLVHVAGVRKVSYYFDDKLIDEKVVPGGELLSDDDCIVDIVQEYAKTNTGVYADLFNNHADRINLLSKTMTLTVESGMFKVHFASTWEKGFFSFSVNSNEGKDTINCKIEANDFLEAYEKARFLLYGMENMNGEIAKHFSELASDKIMEIIKW